MDAIAYWPQVTIARLRLLFEILPHDYFFQASVTASLNAPMSTT